MTPEKIPPPAAAVARARRGADRAALVSGTLLTALAAVWALSFMWRAAILHWYADAWWVYPRLLDLAWWQAALLPDNGHRPVTSQVLRWIDLHAFAGDQRLLRVVGVAWLVGTLLLLVRAAARAVDIPLWLRTQVLLVLVLGVAWLGNARMLGHPYEAVHVYLVMLLVMLAAGLVARSVVSPLSVLARVMLVACGVLAAFVFGSGVALLPAVAVVFVLVGARPADHAVVGLGVVGLLGLYFSMPGADGVINGLRMAPATQFDLWLRWLTTPVLYVGLPLVDPAVARTIPFAPAAAIAVPVAEWSQQRLGDIWTSATPQRLVGVMGVAWLLQASVVARRGRRPQLAVFGLVLAWCGVGVGALVAVTRTEYFADLPRQVHAARYVPWSCLFWSGLAAASLAQYAGRLPPARVAVTVSALALALLASNVGGHAFGAHAARMAAAQSAAARDGHEPTEWGETKRVVFLAALQPARQYRIGPWAGTVAAPIAGETGLHLTEPHPRQ